MALAEPIKKGGRYTKKVREERRSEVFRLHFEYGYSARKISDMMNINRNTINRDVSFCYSKLQTDYDKNGIDDWLNKQLSRLESQRSRLRKELDSDITLQEKLRVEKIILELDFKIGHMIIKTETFKQTHFDLAIRVLNKWMEKEGYKDRYLTRGSLDTIPEKSREKILELLGNR